MSRKPLSLYFTIQLVVDNLKSLPDLVHIQAGKQELGKYALTLPGDE